MEISKESLSMDHQNLFHFYVRAITGIVMERLL